MFNIAKYNKALKAGKSKAEAKVIAGGKSAAPKRKSTRKTTPGSTRRGKRVTKRKASKRKTSPRKVSKRPARRAIEQRIASGGASHHLTKSGMLALIHQGVTSALKANGAAKPKRKKASKKRSKKRAPARRKKVSKRTAAKASPKSHRRIRL